MDIFLQILNKNLRIHFFPSEQGYIRKNFIQYIQKEYRAYIVQNISNSDYMIQIQDLDTKIPILKQGASVYMPFYTQHKNTLTTNYAFQPHYIDMLIRKVVLHFLRKREYFILHASSIIFNNKIYLFCGKSGVGKSTLVSLLQKEKKFESCTDDMICVLKNREFSAFQLPMPEKNKYIKKLKKYKIGGIFFLKRAHRPDINKMSKNKKTFNTLLSHIWTEPEQMPFCIKTLGNFYKTADYYRFSLGDLKDNPTVLSNWLQK